MSIGEALRDDRHFFWVITPITWKICEGPIDAAAVSNTGKGQAKSEWTLWRAETKLSTRAALPASLFNQLTIWKSSWAANVPRSFNRQPPTQQGKKGCKTTAVRCYQCFSLDFLLATARSGWRSTPWFQKRDTTEKKMLLKSTYFPAVSFFPCRFSLLEPEIRIRRQVHWSVVNWGGPQ